MQCVNCRFENLPGLTACGRCGASLQLAAVAIDVHPPRASRRARRWRRWMPTLRSSFERSRAALASAADELVGPLMRVERPPGAVLRRMVVPGWPQIYCGRILRGRIFLGAYLALMALGLVFMGTVGGGVALGLALAVHASTVFDVVLADGRRGGTPIGYGLLICAVLGLVLYGTAGWLISRVATPQVFQQNAPPFQQGDVVVYSRIASAAPGRVVLYDVPPARVPGQQGNVIYNIAGQRIDRILAGPGQNVTCRAGRLFVDGAPSPWQPLNPDFPVAPFWEVFVPHGCFLIVPSTDPYAPGYLLDGSRYRLCLVPAHHVRGVVYLRHQPLSRFAFIR